MKIWQTIKEQLFKKVVHSNDFKIKDGWILSDMKFKERIAGEDWYTAILYELKDGVAKRVGLKSFVLDDIDIKDTETPKTIQY